MGGNDCVTVRGGDSWNGCGIEPVSGARACLHTPLRYAALTDPIVPTLCVGMHLLTLCVNAMDAERPGWHPHAERGDDQPMTRTIVGPASAGKRPVSTLRICGVAPDAFPAEAGPTGTVLLRDSAWPERHDRSHAPRGHAVVDALRQSDGREPLGDRLQPGRGPWVRYPSAA